MVVTEAAVCSGSVGLLSSLIRLREGRRGVNENKGRLIERLLISLRQVSI